MREETIEELEKKAEEEAWQIFTQQDAQGEEILGFQLEEELGYFNSRYQSEELARLWAEAYAPKNRFGVAVVFGMANTAYIRALREQNRDMAIIVYEPSYTITYLNAKTEGFKALEEDEKIYLYAGEENLKYLHACMAYFITYENKEYVSFLVSPNYERMFWEEVMQVRNLYMLLIRTQYYNRNTVLHMSDATKQNIIENTMDFMKQYSLKSLLRRFKRLELGDTPAIIVAAGPSLDKNIKQLKALKKKCFLIAVDTALNALAKEGIVPDISITVDPEKVLTLFEHEKMAEVPLVFGMTSNAKIKNIHKGKRIYMVPLGTIYEKYLKDLELEECALDTGGSVTCDCMSLAIQMGFQKIICVGLDLAYPEGKHYAVKVYEDTEKNQVSEKKLFPVEDIYGNQVLTESNMNEYRKWFESTVISYPEIQFVDATEGGARIAGMEIKTLEEAIHDCRLEREIDFEEEINRTEPIFNEEQRVYVCRQIAALPAEFVRLRKKIKAGIADYEQLDYLNKKKAYTDKDFRKVLGQISKLNQWVTESGELNFLNNYATEKEYEVRGRIYEDVESEYEEFALLASSGKHALENMLTYLDDFEERMQPVIEECRL